MTPGKQNTPVAAANEASTMGKRMTKTAMAMKTARHSARAEPTVPAAVSAAELEARAPFRGEVTTYRGIWAKDDHDP